MYWSIARSGSIAVAGAAMPAAASAASTTRPARTMRLRQVLELLNHDLDAARRRPGRRAVVQEVHAHRLGARHGHARRELATRNNPAARTQRLEQGAIGLPAERVCQAAGRLVEAVDVRRDVVRLHDVLHVLVVGITPAADLDVELAMILR